MVLTNGQQPLYACANHQPNYGFTSDPAGLPEGATGFVDFTNSTFYTEGGTEDISDVLADNPGEGWGFDPQYIQAGIGLVGQEIGTRPQIVGTWLNQILTGATMVFDINLTDDAEDPAHDAQITVFAYDSPDFNYAYGGTLATVAAPTSSNVYAGGAGTSVTDAAEGDHLLAITMTETAGKICYDGGAIFSAAVEAVWEFINACGITIKGGCILRSAVIYPPKSNAEMQALSTL